MITDDYQAHRGAAHHWLNMLKVPLRRSGGALPLARCPEPACPLPLAPLALTVSDSH